MPSICISESIFQKKKEDLIHFSLPASSPDSGLLISAANKNKSFLWSIPRRMCQSDSRMTWKNSIKLSSTLKRGRKINFFRERKWLIELELIYGNYLHQPKVSDRSHFYEQGKRNSVFFELGLLHCNRNWQRRKKGKKNKLTMKDETLTHPKKKSSIAAYIWS